MKALHLRRIAIHGCALVLVSSLAGCSIRTLDSVAAAVAMSTQTERAQERAQMQTLAEATATTEVAPQFESPERYLAVIAQLQAKQLWYASLAHLDVLESQWPPTERSQLLRADALRHAQLPEQSRAIYLELSQGRQAAKAQHGLGLLAAQEEQFDMAVAHLQAARRLTPTDALLLSDLGFAMLHTAQGSQARLPLLQAAQLQPDNTRIHSNVAVYLVLHGAPNEASAWMLQHQMSAEQRQLVLAQAQQLATRTHALTSALAAAEPTKMSGVKASNPVETASRGADVGALTAVMHETTSGAHP